jgi:hypothetical protein
LTQFAFRAELVFNIYRNDPATRVKNNTAMQNLVNDIPMVAPDVLLAGISDSKKCICRIETTKKDGRKAYGTGFLIGADKLITNYHVLEDILAQPDLAKAVVCKFDYEADKNGRVLYGGTDVRLHENFLIDSSTYSTLDHSGTAALTDAWPDDQLDYAVVRLARKVGEEPFGLNYEKADAGAAIRDWIKYPAVDPMIFPGGHLHIFQHPDSQPMQIALGFQKIIGMSNNESRIRYEVNTLPGSSGSPCFNENFEWIGLHNLGDPRWVPAYNQGVSSKKIVQRLQLKGHL